MKKKISFGKNKDKEFIIHEKEQLEQYMSTLGPGDEYDTCFEQWKQLNKALEDMSIWHKIGKSLPWLTLVVTAIGTIVVPVYGMNKAYKEEEVENNLKNGTVFSIATKQMKTGNTPKN